jgi:hypothetical protein
MSRLLSLILAALLAAPALAHEFTAGDLLIDHPHIAQPAASAKAAGGFLTITNRGTTPDRLIGAESAIAARVEVHESAVDANGVGTMTRVEAIDLPPGATVELKHGGYHIMFMGLTAPLTEGEMHKATLIFEEAGRVEVEFSIDPALGQGGHEDHSGHGG